MSIKKELKSLIQIKRDYKTRIDDSSAKVDTLKTEVESLEGKHTQEVQKGSDRATDVFTKLETVKSNLKAEQATLKALDNARGIATPLESQANKTLDVIASELKTIEAERIQAIDEYNGVVGDLLVKAENIKAIKNKTDDVFKYVNKVDSECGGIASKRKDFFIKTANGYQPKHLNARYRYDPKLIAGSELERVLGNALPKPSNW